MHKKFANFSVLTVYLVILIHIKSLFQTDVTQKVLARGYIFSVTRKNTYFKFPSLEFYTCLLFLQVRIIRIKQNVCISGHYPVFFQLALHLAVTLLRAEPHKH